MYSLFASTDSGSFSQKEPRQACIWSMYWRCYEEIGRAKLVLSRLPSLLQLTTNHQIRGSDQLVGTVRNGRV